MIGPSASRGGAPTTPDDEVNDSSKRRELLSEAKTTFNIVESIAGAIPVVGTYVGAAAKVGGTIIDIIQVKHYVSRLSLSLIRFA